MKIEEMTWGDMEEVIPFYIDYYNNHEDGCSTEATAGRRIRQVVKDEMHERYYGKAGYGDAKKFVMKMKWLA